MNSDVRPAVEALLLFMAAVGLSVVGLHPLALFAAMIARRLTADWVTGELPWDADEAFGYLAGWLVVYGLETAAAVGAAALWVAAS